MLRLERLMEALPGFRREMLRLLARSLEHAQCLRADLSASDARARLARFLLDLSHRLEQRGLSATQFRLSMRRTDIARHLGLTLETVSRLLGSLKREGSVELHARHIKLLMPAALESGVITR